MIDALLRRSGSAGSEDEDAVIERGEDAAEVGTPSQLPRKMRRLSSSASKGAAIVHLDSDMQHFGETLKDVGRAKLQLERECIKSDRERDGDTMEFEARERALERFERRREREAASKGEFERMKAMIELFHIPDGCVRTQTL